MADFASSIMLAAVRESLRKDAIAIDPPRVREALVPLSDKRRFLSAVVAAHGLLPLLHVGRILPAMASDATVAALTAARDPIDLFARWSRLERFTHSRHRVIVRHADTDRLIAEHVGAPGHPPAAYEDALIVGVLAALLDRIGALRLRVSIGTQDVLADGIWTLPPPDVPMSRWTFAWDGFVSPNANDATDIAPDAGCVARARRLMAADPGRRWTVAMLAEAVGSSTRSLQRSLAAEGGFGSMVAAARSDKAAAMLISETLPVAMVGFACGYADQPYFTRAFKRRTALTPAAYRAAFAKSGETA